MTRLFSLCIFAFTLAFISPSHAVDIRGIVWGSGGDKVQAGTKLNVFCGGDKVTSASIMNRKKFTVRGIPSDQACQYQVVYKNGKKTKRIDFNTSKAVVTVRGELRSSGDNLFLITK